MFTIVLYILAAVLLLFSAFRDRQKTYMALKKAWKAFENIMPQFLTIILIIGITLATVSPETISKLIGRESGMWGILIAGSLGAVTLIPGFVAFPLAAALLASGAGLVQIAVFVSTLMMVGIITLPAEIKIFGRKAAFLRNGLAFVFSFAMAGIMGVILL